MEEAKEQAEVNGWAIAIDHKECLAAVITDEVADKAVQQVLGWMPFSCPVCKAELYMICPEE